jgi:predicted dehydrogenase
MSTKSDCVNIGVIGAGFIGQLAHIANYAQIKGCRIVALAAGRPELRRKVAQRYDISRTYAVHRELLEDKKVDAVVAVTSRPGTGPVALDCLKAGKSLLTEKPMASSLEQAEKLVEAAKSKNVIYSIGYMRRHDAGVRRAKMILDELIKTGELGPILYTRAHCFAGDAYCQCDGHITTDEKKTQDWDTWPIAPDWIPEDKKQEYHQYLNTYCHSINLARYLFGKAPSVSHVQFDNRVWKTATLDFGDHSVLLETSRFDYRGWDENIEIYFADGKLKITLHPPLLRNIAATVELYKGGSVQQTYQPHMEWSWAFRRQAEAFIRDVREQKESLSSGVDSLEDMRIVETMWEMNLNQ